jgi:hypothetical protein
MHKLKLKHSGYSTGLRADFLAGFNAFAGIFSPPRPLPDGKVSGTGLASDQSRIRRDFVKGCAAVLDEYVLEQNAKQLQLNLNLPKSRKK